MKNQCCHACVILSLLAVTGCFELTAVATPLADPRLQVFLDTGPAGWVELRLSIEPGTDPSGVATPFVSDFIFVDGAMYGAVELLPNGGRIYVIPNVGTLGIPIQINVPGTVPAPTVPSLTLSAIGLTALDTLVATRGDVAHLEHVGFGGRVPGQTEIWSLVAMSGQQSVLSLSGRALPEGGLSLPTSLLPPEVDEGVLHVNGSVSTTMELEPYSAAIIRRFTAHIPFRLNP